MSTKEWLEKQSEDVRRVFLEVGHKTGGEMYVHFAPIVRDSGLPRATVRKACRHLARKGLLEYRNALMDEDGRVCGAGYGVSRLGYRLYNHLEFDEPLEWVAAPEGGEQ